MRKKILGLLISGVLATQITSTVFAVDKNKSLAKTYEIAYNSVIIAKQTKSQESINIARKAILELAMYKNKAIQGYVGEFSKQVDGVQENLFQDFYKVMYVKGNKKSKISQNEINKAREYVINFDTFEGNKIYTSSWSSAIDVFQQQNIDDALAYLDKAMKTKDIKDVEKAEEKIKELLDVKSNPGVLEYAKTLNKKLIDFKKEDQKKEDQKKEDQKKEDQKKEDQKKEDQKKEDQKAGILKHEKEDYKKVIKTEYKDKSLVKLYLRNVKGEWFEEEFNMTKYPKYIKCIFVGREKELGAYGAVYLRSINKPSGTYMEVVRLADEFVLQRINQNGEVQNFEPTELNNNDIERFNNINDFNGLYVGIK